MSVELVDGTCLAAGANEVECLSSLDEYVFSARDSVILGIFCPVIYGGVLMIELNWALAFKIMLFKG